MTDSLPRLRSALWLAAATLRRDRARAWPWVARARELAPEPLRGELDQLLRLVETGPTSEALVLLGDVGALVDRMLGEMEAAS